MAGIQPADALKNKLVSVVVAALAVCFFSILMEGLSGDDVMQYGIVIAAALVGMAACALDAAGAERQRPVIRLLPAGDRTPRSGRWPAAEGEL